MHRIIKLIEIGLSNKFNLIFCHFLKLWHIDYGLLLKFNVFIYLLFFWNKISLHIEKKSILKEIKNYSKSFLTQSICNYIIPC